MVKEAKEITRELGEAYKRWKESETNKDRYRKAFFQLADEFVADSLAVERVEVYGPTEEQAFLRVREQYPGWTIKDRRQTEDEEWEFVIEEDPSLKPFTFVNPEDGQVYTRQIQAGSINLDEDRLKANNPELYEAVTYVPQERRLRDLGELGPEQLASLQKYLYEGKPKVRLAPPREAKPEELPTS